MKVDTTIRRWCPRCGRATVSGFCAREHSVYEYCREHGTCWCEKEED